MMTSGEPAKPRRGSLQRVHGAKRHLGRRSLSLDCRKAALRAGFFFNELGGVGLMDYRARFYGPALGRFIQPDTLIPDPSNPQAFNRYSYVANRPVNFNDPSGHDPWWCEGRNNEAACISGWIQAHVGRSSAQKTPTQGKGEDSNDEGGNGSIGLPAPTSDVELPLHTILHPLDGNGVFQEPIYDYSSNPPRVIGYRIVSYAYDNVYLNPMALLPSPSTPNYVSIANITYRTIDFTSQFTQKQTATILKLLVKPLTKDMAVAPLCPACSLVLKTISAIDIANRVTFIESHLRVHDVYFETPLFVDSLHYQLTIP